MNERAPRCRKRFPGTFGQLFAILKRLGKRLLAQRCHSAGETQSDALRMKTVRRSNDNTVQLGTIQHLLERAEFRARNAPLLKDRTAQGFIRLCHGSHGDTGHFLGKVLQVARAHHSGSYDTDVQIAICHCRLPFELCTQTSDSEKLAKRPQTHGRLWWRSRATLADRAKARGGGLACLAINPVRFRCFLRGDTSETVTE